MYSFIFCLYLYFYNIFIYNIYLLFHKFLQLQIKIDAMIEISDIQFQTYYILFMNFWDKMYFFFK